MSRIGKKAITIPSSVTVQLDGHVLSFSGRNGTLILPVVDGVRAFVSGDELRFERVGDAVTQRAKHGLMRALARNMVEGVSVGFSKKLDIQGIGFRAEIKSRVLILSLGYSHVIEFAIPDDVTVALDKDGKLLVSGPDKTRVGQVAADIRAFRQPDRYKGKGIRYLGERVALKEGKSA